MYLIGFLYTHHDNSTMLSLPCTESKSDEPKEFNSLDAAKVFAEKQSCAITTLLETGTKRVELVIVQPIDNDQVNIPVTLLKSPIRNPETLYSIECVVKTLYVIGQFNRAKPTSL